ncbi:MAG: molecular chaperone DnaK, partial [Candidatus Dormibacteraceae bacterium]
YQTEKLLREQGDKFQGTEKEDVSGALQAVKDSLSGTDSDKIKDATERLVSASQSFSQRLYEQASQSAQASAGGAGGTGSADGAGGAGAGGSDGSDGSSGSSSEEPAEGEVVDAEIVDEQ